ncbi:bifunctional ligase/repressor BirA [bacterium BMS3Abin04]|nr:bifunctional ligase/repressor BirA [bacterium BMS3Abin04]
MFNIEDFDIKLDTANLGRNFIYAEEISSTNSYLMSSDQKLQNGTLFLAEYQTNGKGRLDRIWTSQKNSNLTFSILLKDVNKLSEINLINLATSLAIAQSIENLFQLNIEVKWPNDILIKRKKVAGILSESSIIGKRIDKIVVGIGINVNQTLFTGKYLIQPTSLRIEKKRIINREKLLSELLNILEEALQLAKDDPAKLLNDWRARCKMIGEIVKIESENVSKVGIFEDIDKNGSLILKVKDGHEKFYFGDVSLRKI